MIGAVGCFAQADRQGIEQPLGQGQMLLTSPLGAPEPAQVSAAFSGRRCSQVEQGLQMVEQLGRGGGSGASTAPAAAGGHLGQPMPLHDDITAG